jgi:hypothetical protein
MSKPLPPGTVAAPPPGYLCTSASSENVSIKERCDGSGLIIEKIWRVATCFPSGKPTLCTCEFVEYTQIVHTGKPCPAGHVDKDLRSFEWEAWLTLCFWEWIRNHPEEAKKVEDLEKWKEGHSEQAAKDKLKG